MKKVILIFLSLWLANIGMAQTRVTGRVTGADDNLPIPGVTIQIKGLGGVASTASDGTYSLSNVPPDAVLIFSFIGYKPQEVPVQERTVINISMETDALSLDEVIVVAYGTSTKATFTGAASVISSESIKDVPALSFENALNGKVAGLQVTTFSGQAGSVSAVRVRGVGSINASNEPLYVIDGVPVVSGSVGQMSGQIYSTNNVMSTINPSDIESITILKDAAASSLYGSRAANGVVVITTKRGKQGKPVINFKSSVGLTPDWAVENYTPATTEQQVEMYYENFLNAGLYYEGRTQEVSSTRALAQLNKRFNKHGYTFTAPDHTVNSLTIGGERAGEYYDWESELFRTAVYQTYDLSVSGATETSNYYSSLSYTKEQGRVYINEFDRITGRINVSQKVGKAVEFSTNVNFARTNKSGFNDTRSLFNNYFLQTRNLLWGLYWPTNYQTGEPWTQRFGSYSYNPLYYDNEWDNLAKTQRIAASETVAVQLLPELTFRSILSYDNTTSNDHLYYSALHFSGSSSNGIVREMVTSTEKTVSSSTLNYNKTFGQMHTIDLLAGWEAEKNYTEFQRAEGSDLPTGAL
ncbi:MAG: SusC/RagA family TonB-linked outer membrane protein, partial [Bacteroidales bacterium]